MSLRRRTYSMIEEYPLRRINYIQVQSLDPTKESVVSFSVLPYKLEDGVIIDAPLYNQISYTMVLEEGEGSMLQQAQAYLMSKLPGVE
jgi:hypothetical protein